MIEILQFTILVSENRGYLNLGFCNKDPTIWGSILGSPIFGNPHIGAEDSLGNL